MQKLVRKGLIIFSKDISFPGKFVCHIMSQLLEHVRHNIQLQGQESVNSEQTVNDKNYVEPDKKNTGFAVYRNSNELVKHSEKNAEVVNDESNYNNVRTVDSLTNVEKTNVQQFQDTSQRAKVPDYSDILSELPEEDLQSLVVKNKHGDDILFCDTGKYLKLIRIHFDR